MTVWTGTLPTVTVEPVTAEDLDTMVDALAALTDAWTSYSVTWASSGTQPAIGNGTLEGRYLQAGKLVVVHIRHIMGSTTTFGTGTYTWSLPVNARVSSFPLACYLLDSGTANKSATALVASGLSTLTIVQNTTDVAATAPHTWAVNDRVDICGMYEVS